MNSIYNYYSKLGQDNIGFLYHGIFDDEFTDKIISLSEQNIDKLRESISLRNRISFLIAESFQNIIRHSEENTFEDYDNESLGIFTFRNIGKTYYISTVNLISNENIDKVKHKLTKVNSLSKDELKDLYFEVIEKKDFSAKGGAGLGLIQMASKSENKLEYCFEENNEQVSNFYLQLKIESKKSENIETVKVPLSAVRDFKHMMSEDNTYLVYKGDFSQANVLSLLKIIEKNMQINRFEHVSIKSIIYNTLTELLQNISKHAFTINHKRDGIFIISKYLNKYNISTGNLIKNCDIEVFKSKIDLLNYMSKDELQKLYLNRLKNGNVDFEGNAGLGLIDIARESSEKIFYEILPTNDDYSFLTISVKI